MASNRMWLVNKATGEKTYFATYYRETGWHLYLTAEQICGIFNKAAFGHLTESERMAMDKTVKQGPPFAKGSKCGDEWSLEYDILTNDAEGI